MCALKLSFAAALLALAVLLGAAGPASARSLAVGIADDAALVQGGSAADDAVAAWRRMGVDTARVQVSWSRITPAPDEPRPPEGFNPANHENPGYHWDVIDAAVRRLVNAGIEPILMLDGPPPLWGSGRPDLNNPRYRTSAPAFANFTAAAAARYGNLVDKYILWNEPNLPLWLQPQGECGRKRCTPVAPNTYRAMVRAAYPAIHAADAVSTVLIGALAPAGGDLRSANANMRPLEFLRALGCVDAKLQPIRRGGCRGFQPAPADGISYHPHSTRHAPSQPYANPDNADLGSLKKLEELLDALQARGAIRGTTTPLDLYLDEYGYQTNPPDRMRGVSPGAQDRYLQEAAYIAWRHPRVKLLAQYLYTDEPVGGGTKYTGWQSGLRTADGRAKPALEHFDNPIWLDVPRGLLWGQVRPGAEHRVQVQRRLPGGATAWETLAEVTTGPDGSWSVPTVPVLYASYRAIDEGGHATATRIAVPRGDDEPSAEGELPVDIRTAGDVGGARVPRSFAGFSLEYHAVPSFIGRTRPNPIFARLVGELAKGDNGAPTIRIGGNSTDETWWNPTGAPRPPGIRNDLTPAWIGTLGAWATATRTPLMLGVNLGLNDVPNTQAYAQALKQGLPPRTIAGLELGNEPDLYTRPRTFAVGARVMVRGQRRPDTYDYGQFRDELQIMRGALGAVVPNTPVTAGGFATSAWEDAEDDILSQPGPGPYSFAAHAYALHTCEATRRRTRASYARSLLGANAFTPPITRMGQLAAVAAAHGTALRLSEANSANCGGVGGVSNAFAAALWGTDFLFGMAQAGVRNVDFHGFNGAFYAPVEFGLRDGTQVGRVRPLFYAMLLFNRATPKGAQLLPMGPNPPSATLKTWATIDPAGTRRVVVINKDTTKARSLALRLPGSGDAARVERLRATSVLSKDGITVGGQGYGQWTTDGELRGKATSERLKRKSGAFALTMPAGSAALVTVPVQKVAPKRTGGARPPATARRG